MDISELEKIIKLDEATIKKIKTNEAYIYGISQILFSKSKCFPMQFWDENGQELDQKTVIIVDSSNNNISLAKRDNIIKVSHNGSDFGFSFVLDDENGRFSYKNKLLDIEHTFSERSVLGEVLERTIIKRVGDTKIRIRCYIKDDFIFIREFLQEGKDKSGTIALYNSDFIEMKSDKEIIDYIQGIIDEHAEEIDDDTEDIEEEMYPLVADNSGKVYREDIESKYGEVYYDNSMNAVPMTRYDLPNRVQDFNYDDYQAFMEEIQRVDRGKICNIQDVVIQSEDMDDAEYGLYDDTAYRAYFRDELTDEDDKHEMISLVYEIVSKELQETMDLYEALDTLQDEYDEAVYMIRMFYSKLELNNPDDPEDHSDR